MLGVTVNGAVTVWTLTGAESLVSNIIVFFRYYSLLSVHCQYLRGPGNYVCVKILKYPFLFIEWNHLRARIPNGADSLPDPGNPLLSAATPPGSTRMPEGVESMYSSFFA